MFKINKEELEINGVKLTLETGKVARQADGAIIATLGETVVIATAVGAKKVAEGQDYFPLSVNYQEKYYAAGKIPGGYFKREARPTEAETLISSHLDSAFLTRCEYSVKIFTVSLVSTPPSGIM